MQVGGNNEMTAQLEFYELLAVLLEHFNCIMHYYS